MTPNERDEYARIAHEIAADDAARGECSWCGEHGGDCCEAWDAKHPAVGFGS